MSHVYGPFTASQTAVTAVSGLDPSADRIFVENMTIWPLLVAFADVAPPIAAMSGWPGVATVPQGGKTVTIPKQMLGGGQYFGRLYVLALTDITGQQAASGTTSGNNKFRCTTLVPGEAQPADYASVQGVNLASQPRVINLPMVPHIALSWNLITSVSGSMDFGVIFTYSMALAVPTPATIYLYSLFAWLTHARWLTVQVGVQYVDGSFNVLGGDNLLGTVDIFAGIPTAISPFSPYVVQVTVPATTATIHLHGSPLNGYPAPFDGFMDGEARLDIDSTGQAPPPAIGLGAATPPGVLY